MEVPVVEMVPFVSPTAAVLRAAFVGLDEWNLEEVFSLRGAVMRVVPRFLWGVLKKFAEEAAIVMRRRHHQDAQNQTERRAFRALQFVQMGESGRQALEGADLAVGNAHTLTELKKRPVG